ncbi:DUF6783 domain-containing protein [Robinsoniella peoriensis]|uniref:DUF6783 domain-containing protein n=1 Tax=Robinsoniella TaxID=588605 RepID=UPI003751EB12
MITEPTDAVPIHNTTSLIFSGCPINNAAAVPNATCVFPVIRFFSTFLICLVNLKFSPGTCLKIAFWQLCVTVCRRFVPDEGRVADYVT